MSAIEHSGPICEACGVLYVEEGDGQSCTEPGCVGVVSWAATADRLAAQLREAAGALSEIAAEAEAAEGKDYPLDPGWTRRRARRSLATMGGVGGGQ